jgi:hypothetical protein
MLDTLIKPVRRWQEEGGGIDDARAALWEAMDLHRFGVALLFLAWGRRYVTRFTPRFDWLDQGVFKQRKMPVKDRWGPPPPRRYDDEGNLINH